MFSSQGILKGLSLLRHHGHHGFIGFELGFVHQVVAIKTLVWQ